MSRYKIVRELGCNREGGRITSLAKLLVWFLGAVTIVVALSLFTATNATPRFYYRVTDLGTLGGSASYAFAINDRGQIVGNSTNSSGYRNAFLWEKGTMTNLGTLGGKDSFAYDINNKGQVVGDSSTGQNSPYQQAFLWENGTMKNLDTLGGNASYAQAINNRGQIVGYGETEQPLELPALLWEDGTVKKLVPPQGGDSLIYRAFAINDTGQAVGYVTSGVDDSVAMLWNNYVGQFLYSQDTIFNEATDINNRGQIVGADQKRSHPLHAVLWENENGATTDLGSLGGRFSSANAINNRGQIVGKSDTSKNTIHAFLWQNGRMIDLNNLISANSGWELTEAYDINNKGQIVGYGQFNKTWRAFLLTPTWVIR